MRNTKKIDMFYPYVSERAINSVVQVLKDRWIGQGAKVAEFEERFKETIGVPYAAAVNGVSSAIRLALAVIGVGPGDEVITTPQICTAVNHPILEQYATPVFTDIQYLTANIDPADIEHRITEKTKAIICSHWGGYPCNLEEIHKIAAKHNLPVVEDGTDAVGAQYHGNPIGTISEFTCFSFQAIQQITTGEGGMLCTLDEDNYEAACRRRWFGIDRARRKPNIVGYYDFDVWETGYGYHMTNIAAVMGIAHLEDLDAILGKRDEIAKKYREGLQKVSGVTLFESKADRKSAYYLFTIHVENRDDFCRMMQSKGVQTSIIHERNDRYSVFGGLREDLPVLNKFSKTNISIPLHNMLSLENVEYVIESIKQG
jgi:perosamine synthetase